mmetsp:Transcript_54368/g.143091  ORF Transcript_54368/g.143091 Transcript_54368/m.143091 type:complete len:127 (-) Transcript_54368:436-816(-)
MNAAFGESLHCVAAEPDATFVRFSVADRGREVAYESAVLGRLRRGYRVLLLRLPKTGTRIELCYLFVRISFRSEANVGAKVMHGPSVQACCQAKLARMEAGHCLPSAPWFEPPRTRLSLCRCIQTA